MMPTAVSPMAAPISTRRRSSLAIAARSGELGCSSKTPKVHAETMKAASPPASAKYYGQCRAVRSVISVLVALGRARDQSVDRDRPRTGDRQPCEDRDVGPFDETDEGGERIDVLPLRGANRHQHDDDERDRGHARGESDQHQHAADEFVRRREWRLELRVRNAEIGEVVDDLL